MSTEKPVAPIILFAYARPDHTQKTLDALSENDLAEKSELYVFCDGAKKPSAAENVAKVGEIVDRERTLGRFRSVHVIKSEKNKGLAKSIISGVTEIIGQYGRCIVVEDDLITSPYFLTFMNNCLDFYEQDQAIFSISGFTYPLKALEKYEHDVYLSYRACSHGWATWSDRWKLVDWEVKDFAELEKSCKRRAKFNRGGNDLFRMLRHQMRGERDSWAIRFCYSQSCHDLYAVYPRMTLVRNIGFDGTGTHCSNDKRAQKIVLRDVRELRPETVKPNRVILHQFKNKFRVHFGEAMDWLWKRIIKNA